MRIEDVYKRQSLTEAETRSATEIMHTVGDLERIGDYCINIDDVAEFNFSNKVEFSEQAKFDLEKMFTAVRQIDVYKRQILLGVY